MDAERKKEYWQQMLPALVLLIVLSVPLFLCSGCTKVGHSADMETAQVIRVATAYNEHHFGYHQLEFMAQSVAEKSNGMLQMELYAEAEWSKTESFLEYLDAGTLQMACLPSQEAIALQPMYALYEQPYLFSSLQMVEQYVCGSAAKNALQQLPPAYYGIGMVADGYRYWASQTPNPWCAYGEVSHLASIQELNNMVLYDVQTVYGLHPLIASQKWWDTLTEQQQLWITESFAASLQESIRVQKETTSQELIEKGVTVYTVLPETLSYLTMQWQNQRETYFLSHNDTLTAYWRPVTVPAIIGEET